MEEYSGGSLTPVFKRIHDQECKRSTLIPADFRGSQGSQKSEEVSLPIARETRKVLGTMGGSDVPDELRFILASHSDRNSVHESLSFRDNQDDTVSKPLSPSPPADQLPVPSSSAPPALPLPVFHASLIDDEQNQYDIDGMHTSDEDTKNIFDFTGELQKLNESGAS